MGRRQRNPITYHCEKCGHVETLDVDVVPDEVWHQFKPPNGGKTTAHLMKRKENG